MASSFHRRADAEKSTLIEEVLHREDIVELEKASSELQFAGAVAAFGQQLRGGDYLEDFGFSDIRKLALQGRANDPFGYRGEFIRLVDLADSLAIQEVDRVAAR